MRYPVTVEIMGSNPIRIATVNEKVVNGKAQSADWMRFDSSSTSAEGKAWSYVGSNPTFLTNNYLLLSSTG